MLGRLYHPKGKALETAQQVLEIKEPMSCNIAMGCRNMCKDCYIPYVKPGELREAPTAPCELVIKQIENGMKPEGVFLSFFTDPFLDENRPRTECLMKELTARRIPIATLSKIGVGVENGELINGVRNGMTIVTISEEYRKKLEPKASDIGWRTGLLRRVKEAGEFAWVSLEPFRPPAIWKQDLTELLESIKFVDFIIFGKLNYNELSGTPEAREFYAKAVPEFQDFCKSHGIRHYVKKDTLKFIEGLL